MNEADLKNIKGVGVNLRLEYIDRLLECRPEEINYLEVIPDNFLTSGPHHEKLERLAQDYPLSFHCVGMNIGGVCDFNQGYLKQIRELVIKYNPILLSDHLCFQEFEGQCFHDLLPIPYTQRSLENIAKRIQYLQDFFKRELLIENLSAYDSFDNEFSEVEFMNKLAKMTGCHFLFDLNNIWVNELNGGAKAKDIVKKINIESVKELHLAAPNLDSAPYIDSHEGVPSEQVYGLLEDVLKIKSDLYITYERDENLPEFENWLMESKGIIKRVREV